MKLVLGEPLSTIFNDPDPATPIRALTCAVYWAAIALVLYFILSKLNTRKTA